MPGNNGRVGVVGTSYPGFLAMMAGIDPHPAVKAISPQAPMIDVWIGDDFFHNGAFRQSSDTITCSGWNPRRKKTRSATARTRTGKPVDGFDYFLERGSFAAGREAVRLQAASNLEALPRPPGVRFGLGLARRGARAQDRGRATLTVGGCYDQEDMYGPQEEYAKLEPHDTKHENFLVLGPWRHGYWSSSSQRLGNLDYGEPIGTEFRGQIEAKFFAHYLKDEPGVRSRRYCELPDRLEHMEVLLALSSKRIAANAPLPRGRGAAELERVDIGGGGAARPSYVSDPANPVPYRHRPIQPTYGNGSEWYNWLTEDQRFVTDRKDVAVWKLPVLTRDLTMTGEVVADIFASTTGTDNDMVVKLIDEYPDNDPDPKMRGYQLMTNAEIFRGRYLSGFDKPDGPRSRDRSTSTRFSLHDVDHVFKAGHTVLVEIRSTGSRSTTAIRRHSCRTS